MWVAPLRSLGNKTKCLLPHWPCSPDDEARKIKAGCQGATARGLHSGQCGVLCRINWRLLVLVLKHANNPSFEAMMGKNVRSSRSFENQIQSTGHHSHEFQSKLRLRFRHSAACLTSSHWRRLPSPQTPEEEAVTNRTRLAWLAMTGKGNQREEKEMWLGQLAAVSRVRPLQPAVSAPGAGGPHGTSTGEAGQVGFLQWLPEPVLGVGGWCAWPPLTLRNWFVLCHMIEPPVPSDKSFLSAHSSTCPHMIRGLTQ